MKPANILPIKVAELKANAADITIPNNPVICPLTLALIGAESITAKNPDKTIAKRINVKNQFLT